MTRINVLDPIFLTDQHLFAEYREITRIPKLVEMALESKSVAQILKKIPETYRLNTGHVLFFYNKLDFIEKRYFVLRDEALKRGFNITLKDTIIDYQQSIDKIFYQDFVPDITDTNICIARIIEKIEQKPDFYRFYSQKIDANNYILQLKNLTLADNDTKSA